MYDWNGNGEEDSFDNYMEYQIINGMNDDENTDENSADSYEHNEYVGMKEEGCGSSTNTNILAIIATVVSFVLTALFFMIVAVIPISLPAVVIVWFIMLVIVIGVIKMCRK